MKMREFVNVINIELKELTQPSEIKTLYDLESALTIFNLKKILADYENNESNTSRKLLEPFIVFLATRWTIILDSDAIEQYSPHTPANRVCKRLAKLLGSALSQPPAKFLMPSLQTTESADGTDLLDLLPHQYVLSDNNIVPIEIFACLDSAKSLNMAKTSKEAKPLCYTAKGLTKKELSTTEQARVKLHSTAIKEYLEKLAKANVEELKDNKRKLKTQLESAEYKVIPAFGEAGETRLCKKLYEGMDTREKLFAMLSSIPKELWMSYCEHIGVDKFIYVMSNAKMTSADILAGKSKIEDILDEGYFLNEKEADRCRLFCLYALYREARAHDVYYHGYLDKLSIWPFAYTETSKVDSAKQILDGILSTDDVRTLISRLTDSKSDLYKHRGALKQGVLGKITLFTEQHLVAANPQPGVEVPAQAQAAGTVLPEAPKASK